jgi:aspartyl-tRNA(Asn)/glutamyl-tRNA(Gln) amidotransferase subunit A
MPGVHYVRAQRFRRAFQARLREIFERVDILVAPATPMAAPPIGQQTWLINGEEVPLRPNIGIYTQPISFIGLPVVAVPVQQTGALPLGVQLIAPAWREDLGLRAAAFLEAAGVARAPVADGAKR